MQKKQASGRRINSPIENAALAKKQADKGWSEFAAWINGKDVRGGPAIQKQAARMRAERLRKKFGVTGAQTRRATPRQIPGTK